MKSMSLRLGLVASCLAAASVYLAAASHQELVPPRQPLGGVPMSIDNWIGRREADIAPDVLAVLGADDYIVRTYARPDRALIGLYVGYHASQRQGDTIHSPLNCLPGAGWIPLEQGRVMIPVQGMKGQSGPTPIEVNRVLIGKGLDQQLVYYWYQSHNRVVASEYWGKVYTVLDSVRYHRTDAALVRVITPVETLGGESPDQRATKFVQSLFPLLVKQLPS